MLRKKYENIKKIALVVVPLRKSISMMYIDIKEILGVRVDGLNSEYGGDSFSKNIYF